MTSERQIASNRLNALKSTGPRTLEGKAVSSANATVHGLTSRRSYLLDCECASEFQALRDSLEAHYQPQGPTEVLLVDTLAITFWRLARIPRFEAMLLQALSNEDR